LFALLLVLSSGVAGRAAGPPPLEVLFIGNSYTYVNDLPSLVAGLAEAAGGRSIDVDRHLVGGCTLERHVKDKKAVDKIREKRWDVVVLQEHSLRPVLERYRMHRYARVLDQEIKRQGAKTVFYLTWARQDIPEMQEGAEPAASPGYVRAMYQISGRARTLDFNAWCKQERAGLAGGLNGAYFDIARELGAGVAPVGAAWKNALAADPALVLHQADKSHPGPKGSYLAACVFYATLLGRSPVGLPGEISRAGRVLVRVAPEEAKSLQEIAWKTVQETSPRLAPGKRAGPHPAGETPIPMNPPATSYRGPLPPADDDLRSLAGSLRRRVEHLAEKIGERNLGEHPRELAKAADYIDADFRAAGFTVKRQEYEVAGTACANLEVEIPGTVRAGEIAVVGAHYDSVIGAPGANDNGSGVAAMLCLARQFAARKTDRTLRFVAFVNEEPPYFQTGAMGSWVYAKRCRRRAEKVTAMLALETIGYYDDAPGSQQYPQPFGMLYPSTGNFIGFVGNLRSAGLLQQALTAFRRAEQFPSEGAALPEMVPGVGFSDHWSFWQEGYPGVMVTDTAMFRYPHYHQRSDTADKIDFDRLARVVRGLERVIAVLAGPDRPTPAGKR
jgi:hypothetical protein